MYFLALKLHHVRGVNGAVKAGRHSCLVIAVPCHRHLMALFLRQLLQQYLIGCYTIEIDRNAWKYISGDKCASVFVGASLVGTAVQCNAMGDRRPASRIVN